MRKNTTYFLVFSVAILLASCGGDKSQTTPLTHYSNEELAVLEQTLDLPDQPFDYNVTFPSHFLSSGGGNLDVDANMATLGRVLFYDPILSANDQVSCASCHTQEDAFSDKVAFSDGFEGEKTVRNSFALGTVPNVALYYGTGQSRFFWDHRAGTVEEQCEMTLTNEIEMGMNLDDLPAKLEQKEYYRILFKKAFKQEQIETHLALAAISQFLRSFNNTGTPFDKELENVINPNNDFPNFTAKENRGKALFNQKCGSCHGKTHVFIGTGVANNGLQSNYLDKGIGALDNQNYNQDVFKVPLLRNVTLTAPYMHDGRFATLDEVLDHYSTGIANHPNLHSDLKQGNEPVRMNFSQDDKSALIAYLNTLTDENFIHEPKYSDPFK